jgi:uncharacterized membrane protein YoaK (UPF0700 family)
MTMTAKQTQMICCMVLCTACGIVDAVGFVRHGIFAANMTGNTVLLGLSVAHAEWAHALERALPLVAFFLGSMLARLLLSWTGKRPWIPLLCEAALIGLALVLLSSSTLSLALIAFAMGMQASAVTQFSGVTLSTVVITSTMARIAEAFADRLSALAPRSGASATPSATLAATPPARPPLGLYMLTWVCYLSGALIAGLTGTHATAAMLTASLLVLAAAWMTRRP